LPILIVLIFVNLEIIPLFLRAIMIVILFYLVCLMLVLLLDHLLSELFKCCWNMMVSYL